jgi:hypothetical protein
MALLQMRMMRPLFLPQAADSLSKSAQLQRLAQAFR